MDAMGPMGHVERTTSIETMYVNTSIVPNCQVRDLGS